MTDVPKAPETPDAPVTSVARRPRPIGLVVVLVAVVVAALLCWRHLRDGREHAAVGETFAATQALPATRSSRVETPAGGLDVRVTRPLAGVDDDPAVRDRQAPDDGSFVGLQIAPADDAAVTRWRFRDEPFEARFFDVDFALIADGRRYPVREYDQNGAEIDDEDDARTVTMTPQRVYVAVAGTPRRLSLEVTYAGEEQTVDLVTGAHTPGRFAALYRNRAVDVACGAAAWSAGFAADARPPSCRVDLLQRTPYYPGRGWAPAGREWLVVGVATSRPAGLTYRSGGDAARYEVFGLPDVSVRLAGAAPVATGLFSNVFGADRHDVSLFSIAAGAAADLTVRAEYANLDRRVDSVRGDPPYDADASATWRVRR